MDATASAQSADTNAKLALTLSMGAMFLMPIAVTGTNLAFPAIEADFEGTTRATLSWTLSGYSIVLAALTLIGGLLTRRFGGDRVFGAGLAVFAGSSLIAAVAPNVAVLIFGRGIQGAAGALLIPSGLVVVTDRWPQERHTFAIGIWTVAFPMGSIFAPTVAAASLEFVSWRWIFGGTAVLSLMLLGLLMLLPGQTPVEGSPERFEHPDYLGMVVGTVAVALFALGIVQGPTWGWSSGRVLAALLIAAALVPVFIALSQRHPRPLIDPGLFSIRTYSVASAGNVLVTISGTAVWLIWPLLLGGEWGYEQLLIGLAITPTPLVASIITVVGTRTFFPRFGFGRLLATGMAALAVADMLFLVTLDSTPNYLGAMLPGLILFGIGMGLTFAPINAAALMDVPTEDYGQANAGFNTGRSIASAIGVAVAVAALGEGATNPIAGFERAYVVLAIVSLVGGVFFAVAWPRTDHARVS